MQIIVVTGTPGTGKTYLAKKLAKALSYSYINLNRYINDNKFNKEYDKYRKCYTIDISKLVNHLIKYLNKTNKNVIIDSHLSHYIPRKYVNLCIVTRCDLKTLRSRLIKRKYLKSKINENLECEIMEIILNEAYEYKHKILIIDTSKKISIKKIIQDVKTKKSY